MYNLALLFNKARFLRTPILSQYNAYSLLTSIKAISHSFVSTVDFCRTYKYSCSYTVLIKWPYTARNKYLADHLQMCELYLCIEFEMVYASFIHHRNIISVSYVKLRTFTYGIMILSWFTRILLKISILI